MVLPSTNQIDSQTINNEYKIGANNFDINNLRSMDVRLPQSGPISFSDFRNLYYYPSQAAIFYDATDSLRTSTTWTDLIGNINAILVGNPPHQGTYFSFNGSTQWGKVPSISNKTNFTASQQYSVSFWAYFDQVQNDLGNGDNDVVEKWDVGINRPGGSTSVIPYPYVFRFIRDTDRISAAIYTHTTGTGSGGTASLNNSVPKNTWNFICGTFDWPQGTMKIYTNGALSAQTTLSLSSGYIENNHDLFIMARGSTGDSTDAYNRTTGRFAMLMTHARILSAIEIDDFYKSSRGRLI